MIDLLLSAFLTSLKRAKQEIEDVIETSADYVGEHVGETPSEFLAFIWRSLTYIACVMLLYTLLRKLVVSVVNYRKRKLLTRRKSIPIANYSVGYPTGYSALYDPDESLLQQASHKLKRMRNVIDEVSEQLESLRFVKDEKLEP